MDKAVEKAVEVFKRLTPAEIEFVKKTSLAPSGFSGKLTKEETGLLVYYCSHPRLITYCLKILDEKEGEGAVRLGEAINYYKLMMGDSTAHDISMDEALRRVKEEMELPEGVEMVHCTMCGRSFESVKGRITLTCSEACSQKWIDTLGRLIWEIIEFRERSAKRQGSIAEQLR